MTNAGNSGGNRGFRSGAPAHKLRHSKGYVLKRLGKYLWHHAPLLALALALMVLSNLFALAGPKISGHAIDAIKPGAVDFDTVIKCCVLMAVLFLLSALLSYALSVLMIDISKKITKMIREDIFRKLSSLPVSFFDTHQTGDTVSRISYDVDTLGASLSNDIIQMGASLITVVGAFVMMCSISLPMMAVFLVTVPMAVAFTVYKTKRVRPLFRKRSEKLGELNGYIEEIISGNRTVKAYGKENVFTDRFDVYNNNAVEAHYNADYHAVVVGPSVNLINNISLSFISVLGAVLFLFERVSLGNISSFILYSRRFSGPINEAANIISELQSALSAADRIFSLLEEDPETPDVPDALPLEVTKGDVAFEKVTFGYTPDKTVLKDFSLEVPGGSRVAIVGPTGAGKTTVINLLMRFYDANSGRITIDGKDITKVTRKSLRNAFTMVLQDTWMFRGTIAENIAYGNDGATLDDIKRVAKAARIDSFIEKLPKGYDTLITDDGAGVSKGQKQLITIARAMLVNSQMLILDEATSNVDSRTEKQISDAMDALMKGKTCFIIAHRLSTIENADKIIVVDDGTIIESGNHRELLQKGGFYANLYNSQFD